MRIRRFARGRWLWLVPGVLLFLFIVLSVFIYTLPGETVLSALRPMLARGGVTVSPESARMEFPLAFRMENATLSVPGGGTLRLDTVRAGFEITGLLRWLPFHAVATMGKAKAEIRTSPMAWNPGKGRISLEHLGSEDLLPLFPASVPEAGFLLDTSDLRWEMNASGELSGTGKGTFSWMRVPIPEQSSPIREALLEDVTILFAMRGGSLIVSSFTGTYEGARVEGNGEIAGLFHPPRSKITFNLRIENPLEGKIASIFDLLSKNAKNANLRITGTLLSPTGEFQFF